MSAATEDGLEAAEGALPEKPSGDHRTSARAAGRGGVAVLGAKVFFILTGLVQQTILPRAIGIAQTGILARILSIASLVNNVMVTGSVQGVSRAVAAAGPDREKFVFRDALRLHVPIALVLAALFWLAAPYVAAFEEAPYITTPLRVLALVVAFYGMYAPLVGALNGRGQFTRQAALDIVFATVRTTGLLAIGWFFWHRSGQGALGASIGFAAAAAFILLPALRWSGTGAASNKGNALDRRAYLLGLAPLALTQLLTNGLMQADITLLGRFLSIGAVTSGLHGAAASKAADEWVAIYRFCQYFAFLPYQLVMSVTQILFPLVARAHAEGDREAVRRYVERGARIAVIASGALVAVVAALPGSVLYFVYGADVAARGADTLRILAIGQGAFTMFGIATTVLASLGRERVAAILSFVTLAAVAGGCWFLAASAPFGEAQLQANAIAVSSALVVGLIVAAIVVSKIAGGFVPFVSMARVLVVVGASVAIGMHVGRLGRLMAPLAAAAIVALYLIALVVLRELGGEDARALRAIVDRRRT
ncbi:MAG: MATE family efflux transporter [Polyangiaceae bacterium]